MDAPNVLLIMADQLAPHFTGAYGHPIVRTPHLDALAERGATFDAAYAPSPLCAPSRAAFLTGRSVSALEAWDNATELPASTPTLAHYLRLSGYQTSVSGKMHFVGPDQLHGFDERLTTDIYPADFAWTPDWDHPDERIDKWYHNMAVIHEAGPAVTTYQLDYDEEVGFAARRKIHDLARSDDDRPFFLAVSFIHPHDPYVARQDWWDRYDGVDIDMPDPFDVDRLDPHSQRIRRGIAADTVGYTEEQTRNARRAYYANVSYIDDWIGKLIAGLRETDVLDDTIVIVTSDHGDMLGDRGCWFKMSFFERAARVPLIVAGPGIIPHRIPNACSLVDLVPTFLDLATPGGDPPVHGVELEGRSLWPLLSGGHDGVDETCAEYMAEMTSHPMFMIRRGRYKYIHCATDPPLLYDVVADPLERTNLAGDTHHAEVAAGFAAEVAERWDGPGIRRRVLASQQARRTVHAAMELGPHVSWDHLPVNDVANSWVRNHRDWAEAGPRSRYPRWRPAR